MRRLAGVMRVCTALLKGISGLSKIEKDPPVPKPHLLANVEHEYRIPLVRIILVPSNMTKCDARPLKFCINQEHIDIGAPVTNPHLLHRKTPELHRAQGRWRALLQITGPSIYTPMYN